MLEVPEPEASASAAPSAGLAPGAPVLLPCRVVASGESVAFPGLAPAESARQTAALDKLVANRYFRQHRVYTPGVDENSLLINDG